MRSALKRVPNCYQGMSAPAVSDAEPDAATAALLVGAPTPSLAICNWNRRTSCRGGVRRTAKEGREVPDVPDVVRLDVAHGNFRSRTDAFGRCIPNGRSWRVLLVAATVAFWCSSPVPGSIGKGSKGSI